MAGYNPHKRKVVIGDDKYDFSRVPRKRNKTLNKPTEQSTTQSSPDSAVCPGTSRGPEPGPSTQVAFSITIYTVYMHGDY